MRTEYVILGGVVLLIAVAAAVLAAAVYFTQSTPTTSTTTSTTTTQATIATTSSTTETDSTTSSSTTTTTTEEKVKSLSITLSEEKIFKNDDLLVTVLSEGDPVADATVTLDGGSQETDNEGSVTWNRIGDGNRSIKASKEGYASASINISVNPLPYVLSADVKTQRTPEERAAEIAEGKTVFRFYDTPNCPNCLRMKPWANDIANINRNCVAYESLNMIHEEAMHEVKDIFPNQLNVVTPIVIIEGSGGRYISTGFIPKPEIENRIRSAAGGRCKIQ